MKLIKKNEKFIKKGISYLSSERLTIKKIFSITHIKFPINLIKIRNNYVPYVTMNISKTSYHYGTVYFQDTYYEKNPQKAYDKAKERGAALCFLTGKIEDKSQNRIPFIIVDNPHVHFIKICKYLKKKHNVKTIAISGSVGKTSAKQFIYSVLSSKYECLENPGNYNLRTHVGATIQLLKRKHKFYIQEVGGCIPNMVEDSAKMLFPNCFVITNIGNSHIENYGSQQNIAKDKLSIDKYLKRNGIAILNFDDKILSKAKLNHKVISYAIENKNADYYAENIKQNNNILQMTVITPYDKINVEVNCIGKHNAYNVLLAFAVGNFYKMTNEEIKNGLKNYHPKGVRQNLIEVSGKFVYLDCFNSAYDSVKSALAAISEIKNKGKKIIVLGDILELGDISKETHENVGKLVDTYKFDIVATIGKNSKYIIDNIKNNKTKKFHTLDQNELIQFLSNNISVGDLILFKASHGMKLNLVVDRIFGTAYYFQENAKFKKKIIDKNIEYNKLGNELELCKYPVSINEVIIDNYYDKYKITRLFTDCFKDNEAKKIIVNENIRNISTDVFYNCSNLKEVDLANAQYISKHAFNKCPSLEKIYIRNINCHAENEIFKDCPSVKLFLPKDAYLIEYAKENNIEYEFI